MVRENGKGEGEEEAHGRRVINILVHLYSKEGEEREYVREYSWEIDIAKEDISGFIPSSDLERRWGWGTFRLSPLIYIYIYYF